MRLRSVSSTNKKNLKANFSKLGSFLFLIIVCYPSCSPVTEELFLNDKAILWSITLKRLLLPVERHRCRLLPYLKLGPCFIHSLQMKRQPSHSRKSRESFLEGCCMNLWNSIYFPWCHRLHNSSHSLLRLHISCFGWVQADRSSCEKLLIDSCYEVVSMFCSLC